LSTTRTESEAAEHVRGELAGVSNALVLASADDPGLDELCPTLLLAEEPEETDLLWVTYTSTPDACIRKWLRHADERPADLKVISVGDVMRSAAAAQSGGSRVPTRSAVDSLSNPADLTGLGIKISEQLQEWNDDGNRTVACYDSLTAALQYTDLQTLYKFLHVLTGRFETVDATAHFHLDPDAHDDATVNTLKSLFEAVVERADGAWRVSRR
jgi:hypothetical protein